MKQRFRAPGGSVAYDTSFGLPFHLVCHFGGGITTPVYGNALFGYTGAPLGERCRIEGGTTVAFADGGPALNSAPDAERALFLSGGRRDPVFSVGVGLSGNLFGAAIPELDLIQPFSRPQRDMQVQFGLAPGF